MDNLLCVRGRRCLLATEAGGVAPLGHTHTLSKHNQTLGTHTCLAHTHTQLLTWHAGRAGTPAQSARRPRSQRSEVTRGKPPRLCRRLCACIHLRVRTAAQHAGADVAGAAGSLRWAPAQDGTRLKKPGCLHCTAITHHTGGKTRWNCFARFFFGLMIVLCRCFCS